MQKITFVNSNGDSMTFGNGFPYYLKELHGVSSAITNVQNSQGYQQDGATYIDNQLTERTITFDVGLRQPTQAEVYTLRRALIKHFNPKLGEGWLTYENDSIKFKIKAVSQSGGDFDFTAGKNNYLGYQWASLTMIASDPLFQDYASTTIKMEDLVGGLTFPIKFPIKFAHKGDHAFITITGDVPAPVLIEFRGPAETPTITQVTTEKLITVAITLLENEKLWINTQKGNKTVIFEDADGVQTSAFNDIDADSDFDDFSLIVGENEIAFSAVSGSPAVYITYSNRWVGC